MFRRRHRREDPVQVQHTDSHRVRASLHAEITSGNADGIARALSTMVDNATAVVELDLSALSGVTGSGAEAFYRLLATARGRCVRVLLLNLSNTVQEDLARTAVPRILDATNAAGRSGSLTAGEDLLCLAGCAGDHHDRDHLDRREHLAGVRGRRPLPPRRSGVASVSYATSGAQTTPAATVPGDTIALAHEGETTVTFHPTDHVGNTEPERTLTVRVDKSPPASALTTADPITVARLV